MVSPVTHMPEKLYMSSATISMSSTMAIGLEWNIICNIHRVFMASACNTQMVRTTVFYDQDVKCTDAGT